MNSNKYDRNFVSRFKMLYEQYYNSLLSVIDLQERKDQTMVLLIDNHHEMAIAKQKHDEWVKTAKASQNILRGYPKYDNAPMIVATWHYCGSVVIGHLIKKDPLTVRNRKLRKKKNEKQLIMSEVNNAEQSNSGEEKLCAKKRYRKCAIEQRLLPPDKVSNVLMGVTESVSRSYRRDLENEGFIFERDDDTGCYWVSDIPKPPAPPKPVDTIKLPITQQSEDGGITAEDLQILKRFINLIKG